MIFQEVLAHQTILVFLFLWKRVCLGANDYKHGDGLRVQKRPIRSPEAGVTVGGCAKNGIQVLWKNSKWS